MPSNAPIKFQFQGFPAGYCPPDFQKLGNDFASLLTGYLPGGYITVLTGDTEPGVNDRDKPWIRSDGRWYLFAAPGLGKWVSRNMTPVNTIQMGFFASEADIWSFDGGDGSDPSTTTPTASTGAMWEKVSELDGRMPIGPGTLTSAGTVIASGDTGGNDQAVLLSSDLPPHKHIVPAFYAAVTAINNSYGESAAPVSDGRNAAVGSSTGLSTYPNTNSGPNTDTSTQTPVNTIPPYCGIYFIRRTARIWYTT